LLSGLPVLSLFLFLLTSLSELKNQGHIEFPLFCSRFSAYILNFPLPPFPPNSPFPLPPLSKFVNRLPARLGFFLSPPASWPLRFVSSSFFSHFFFHGTAMDDAQVFPLYGDFFPRQDSGYFFDIYNFFLLFFFDIS